MSTRRGHELEIQLEAGGIEGAGPIDKASIRGATVVSPDGVAAEVASVPEAIADPPVPLGLTLRVNRNIPESVRLRDVYMQGSASVTTEVPRLDALEGFQLRVAGGSATVAETGSTDRPRLELAIAQPAVDEGVAALGPDTLILTPLPDGPVTFAYWLPPPAGTKVYAFDGPVGSGGLFFQAREWNMYAGAMELDGLRMTCG